MSFDYVVNPDGTITPNPTPDDYAYVREEEDDLQTDEL